MAGGEVALQRGVEHRTTLTDIGNLYGFWCTCGRSVVGWRLKEEASWAAAQHCAGNQPYGTCIYCVERGVLTRFGWCESCHPRLSETRTTCLGCGTYTRRVKLGRDGYCEDCHLRNEKWRNYEVAK